jgi:hypothetical protein
MSEDNVKPEVMLSKMEKSHFRQKSKAKKIN